MLKLGRLHADIEARKELEPLLATLVANPSYEFYPLCVGFRGGETTRRYYTQFFESFMESIVGYELVDEWANERSVAQEYDITIDAGGGPETHRVVGILFAAETPEGEMLLGGERVYASERCVRQMAGVMFDELAPL
jgi:hypothetical protein